MYMTFCRTPTCAPATEHYGKTCRQPFFGLFSNCELHTLLKAHHTPCLPHQVRTEGGDLDVTPRVYEKRAKSACRRHSLSHFCHSDPGCTLSPMGLMILRKRACTLTPPPPPLLTPSHN